MSTVAISAEKVPGKFKDPMSYTLNSFPALIQLSEGMESAGQTLTHLTSQLNLLLTLKLSHISHRLA